MTIKISYHDYCEDISSQLIQDSFVNVENILSNIFGDTFLVVPAVFILPLYASRYTQNARRHEHRPLRDNLSRQGKPPWSDERDEPAITI